jgi:hypothetical protein
MRFGEQRAFRAARLRAANDNRRRPMTWRRAVSAAIVGSFALMLISMGFQRYAYHVAPGVAHPLRFLAPN